MLLEQQCALNDGLPALQVSHAGSEPHLDIGGVAANRRRGNCGLLKSWAVVGEPASTAATRRTRPRICLQNRNEYPPQPENPKGEIHEDEGWFSYDRTRKRIVLRQFHVESFVNQYVEEPSPASSPIVFTTEAIENIPSGWAGP